MQQEETLADRAQAMRQRDALLDQAAFLDAAGAVQETHSDSQMWRDIFHA